MNASDFFERGWVSFPVDPGLEHWRRGVEPTVEQLLAAPNAEYRCDGTWFPGVNILPNDADGGIGAAAAPALADLGDSPALCFIRETLGLEGFAWDRAQISVCFPGYPRQGDEETDAAFRYRKNRDAAHVDGLLRVTPSRNRRLGETHGFILGLPLFGTGPPGASPFVVWENSHEIMRAAFQKAFADAAPERWGEIDVTEIYQAARRRCFEECRRVEVIAPSGGAYIVHRLALHGVASWTAPETARGRAIAYFRPDPFPKTPPGWWLSRP